MKTQNVRLLDVLALGPFMVWFAMSARGVPGWARAVMVASGLGTMLYNAANYIEQERMERMIR